MKRIYISGGITNVPDYFNRFNEAEIELMGRGYTSIVNPAAVNRLLPEDFTHKEYMAVSIAQLSCCEAIYLLKGWEKSAGALQEYMYAVNHKMEIVEQGAE